MSKYLETQNRVVSFTGNGNTVSLLLYKDNVFIKTLKSGVATVDTVTQEVIVNTDLTDSLPSGTGYNILIDDGINAPGVSIPENFEIVQKNFEDFPAIGWFSEGAVFHPASASYNDSLGTIPSELEETDPANSSVLTQVGSKDNGVSTTWEANYSSNLSVAPRLSAINSKPSITCSQGRQFFVSSTPNFINDNYIEEVFCLDVSMDGDTAGSSITPISYGDSNTGTSRLHLECTNDAVAANKSIRLKWDSTVLYEELTVNTLPAPIIVRVRYSTAPGFGDTKVYLTLDSSAETEVHSVPYYLAVSGLNVSKTNIGSGSFITCHTLAGLIHKNKFSDLEAAGVNTWFKNVGGLS